MIRKIPREIVYFQHWITLHIMYFDLKLFWGNVESISDAAVIVAHEIDLELGQRCFR